MTDRIFTRRSDGGILSANHINELQAALESDDTRIKANTNEVAAVKGRVTTLEDSRVRVLRGTCATNTSLSAKTITLSAPWNTYTPVNGDMFAITYTSGQSASTATININDKGAFPVRVGNQPAQALGHTTDIGGVLLYTFDGVAFHLVGSQQQKDTTYTEIPDVETNDPTSTTGRLITGRAVKLIKDLILAEATSPEISEAEITEGTASDPRTFSGRRARFLETRILGLAKNDEIPEAEITAGTASTLRTITARRLRFLESRILGLTEKSKTANGSGFPANGTLAAAGDRFFSEGETTITGLRPGSTVKVMVSATMTVFASSAAQGRFGLACTTQEGSYSLVSPNGLVLPTNVTNQYSFSWTFSLTVGASGAIKACPAARWTAGSFSVGSVYTSVIATGLYDG